MKAIAEGERENESLVKEEINLVMQIMGVNVDFERDIDQMGRIGKFTAAEKDQIQLDR